jgi:hypothetical protein
VNRLAFIPLLLLLGAAPRPVSMPVAAVPFPFGHATATPYVVSDDHGGFAISWVDRKAKTFNLAHYDGTRWSNAVVIAHGDMLDNKADYPSIAMSGPNGFAQWRERAGEGRLIRLARTSDGGATWTAPITPHPAMAREFGFVSMLPLPDGTARVAWLDGRETQTALRAATLTHAGTLTAEAVVDARVCDCCQTAMAGTSRGPVLVYRDRSDREIRDIVIAQPVAKAQVTAVHADGWHLTGCPVNGPRITARGSRVAVAWFTAAGGKPAVNVAFSTDGGATFAAPIRIDEGRAAGRVDLALLDDQSAIVTWVETAGKTAHILTRRVAGTGAFGHAQVIGSGVSPASIGFPRIAVSRETVLATWNGDDGVQLVVINSQKR